MAPAASRTSGMRSSTAAAWIANTVRTGCQRTSSASNRLTTNGFVMFWVIHAHQHHGLRKAACHVVICDQAWLQLPRVRTS